MVSGVKLGSRFLEVPIIQGGMGVGISLGNLAGHVMKEKGMGVISAAHPGYRDPLFRQQPDIANINAICQEALKAREISQGNGLLALNIMVAGKQYAKMVQAAVDAKYDAIISGAGLPLQLPGLVGNNDILLAPIVSSGKALRLIATAWDRHYQRTMDFVVIEGYKAGGHLGFKKEDLMQGTCQELEDILKEVLEVLIPFEEKYQRRIPVFVAGGIFDGKDIAYYLSKGASGVQIGTRFIATYECDADPRFKQAILDCKKEDIVLVDSPTGFPGRGLLNPFMRKVKERGPISITHCLECLTPCTPSHTPYYISEALIQAVKGNVNQGLVFVGENASRINTMTSVHQLMETLIDETNRELNGGN